MFRYFKKPLPLTREIVPSLKDKCVGVSRKCDGVLIAIKLFGANLVVFDINHHEITSFETKLKFKFIIYGEYYNGICYVFDISLVTLSYSHRYKILKNIVKNELQLKINPVIFGYNIFKFIKNLPIVDFKTDGFIFTPDLGSISYKWKDRDHLTADLLVINCTCYAAINIRQFQNLPSILKIEENCDKNYFPIKFKHVNNLYAYKFGCNEDKYEGQIVECLFRENCWIPVQIRKDKTEQMHSSNDFCGPNNWKTVTDIYEETLNPILYEELQNY